MTENYCRFEFAKIARFAPYCRFVTPTVSVTYNDLQPITATNRQNGNRRAIAPTKNQQVSSGSNRQNRAIVDFAARIILESHVASPRRSSRATHCAATTCPPLPTVSHHFPSL